MLALFGNGADNLNEIEIYSITLNLLELKENSMFSETQNNFPVFICRVFKVNLALLVPSLFLVLESQIDRQTNNIFSVDYKGENVIKIKQRVRELY